jgi:hypothetical protein
MSQKMTEDDGQGCGAQYFEILCPAWPLAELRYNILRCYNSVPKCRAFSQKRRGGFVEEVHNRCRIEQVCVRLMGVGSRRQKA